jgi:hypothetical protein
LSYILHPNCRFPSLHCSSTSSIPY